MDLRQLEYILAIGECGNMTQAAEQLFVTPSALNQQLLKLEKALGTLLFQRLRGQLVPTQAGQVYLKNARKIMLVQQSTYSEIQDIVDCHTGTYRIGMTFEHGMETFAHVYPIFHERFPHITINCREMNVNNQMELLEKGGLDIGFVVLGKNYRTENTYITLSEENLVLGVNTNHPLAHLQIIRENRL